MSKLRSPMDIIAFSAYYGMYDPFKTGPTMHYGVDMTGTDNKGGDKVLAPHGGYVYSFGTDVDGSKYIIAKHWGVDDVPKGHIMVTTYWHLYSISSYIKKDYKLTIGETIATEGNTGHVTGPHLHFGVFIVPENYKITTTTAMRKYAVDPLKYLHCYPDQTIKNDPKKLMKKYTPVKQPIIVTVKGELLEQEGDVFTVKGKIV